MAMKKLQGQSGFSITELLISVVIISIGIVGFASAVGLAGTELWFGRRDTEVSMLVSDQIEILKATGHDAVSDGQRVQGDYRLDWTVSGSDPKEVTLIATYDRHAGGQRSDTIVFYVARR